MTLLPEHPNLDQLKKQAKDLLALSRRGDVTAVGRFRDALPAAAGKSDTEITDLGLRLHDAQSCLAREYGFPSWADLKSFVSARRADDGDRGRALIAWARLAYPGDISGGTYRGRPAVAARILAERPGVFAGDPYVACAIGDEAVLRSTLASDPTWIDRPGGPLKLPPLLAVTHSTLVRLPAFRERLHNCAKLLLDAGADPNQSVTISPQPRAPNEPGETYRLSALYGAAGQNHNPELTKLLLDVGADPNDGESLYHSLENPACTRLLLEAGARVVGSNAFYRIMDLDDVETLRLLLAWGADPNEPPQSRPTSDWGTPLLWAIRRGRSPAHIEALLAAGADPSARTPDGMSAYAIALRFGLTEAAEMLREGAGDGSLPDDECFIAACAAGDEAKAREIQARRPDLPEALSETQLRLLPELASLGRSDASQLMVRLGWPIATRAGDWEASALNHAVFRGDADLASFLLEHGASWREVHGFGDNVCGTLAWASCNEPSGPGDWLGCAETLVAHGMPGASRDPQDAEAVIVNGQRKWFSDDVTDFLLGVRPSLP
jgi:ankyrin repeat protein